MSTVNTSHISAANRPDLTVNVTRDGVWPTADVSALSSETLDFTLSLIRQGVGIGQQNGAAENTSERVGCKGIIMLAIRSDNHPLRGIPTAPGDSLHGIQSNSSPQAIPSRRLSIKSEDRGRRLRQSITGGFDIVI